MNAIGEFLVHHGPMLLVGVTALLSAAAVALLLQRSPIHRQRLAEMAMLCAIAWAVLACVPMHRWTIDYGSAPRAVAIGSRSSIDKASESSHPADDPPSDWQSLLPSLIRPASSSTSQRLADRVSSDVSTAQAAFSESSPTSVAKLNKPARKSRWHLLPSTLSAWTYLIGAAACAGWLLLGHLLLWRVTRTARGPEPWLAELFDNACRQVGVRRARVLVASAALRPVSCGLLKPTVLLGADDCAADNRSRLRQVLLHEAAHLKQRDAWGNALFNLAMPVLYFHPLYWLIRSKASLAREMVADDIAASSTSRAAYAADLLELARTRAGYRPAPLAAVGIFRSPSHFYRRMHMLMQRNIRLENRCSILWKLTSGVACAVVLAGACATFGVRRAVAQEAPAKEEIKQEKLDHAILDAKKALNEAAAQRDVFIQQVKAGLTPPMLQKYTNLAGGNPLDEQVALLDKELQVAKQEFGEDSRRYKDIQTRLDSIKPQQEDRGTAVNEKVLASLKAQLDSQVALAKQNLDDVQTAQQSVRSAAQDEKDNQDDIDQAKQQREKQAIEKRQQLQEMQSRQERQMLEAKLKESEAQLAQMRAMLSQMQDQVKAQTDQARAEVDRANAMLKQQMANAQSQQNGADNQRIREKIDALLLDRIKKEGMQRPQWGEINEMIRRSYLDALGREPTVDDWNAAKEFAQAHLQINQKNGNPAGGQHTPAGQEPTGLSAAVGGLRPQLDLVALANSYADATANVMVARQTLDDARSNTEQANAKARLAGAEHKARLLRSIADAALNQARKEMELARKRYEMGVGEAGTAFDAEGRVHILSLIVESTDGKQSDLQRQ